MPIATSPSVQHISLNSSASDFVGIMALKRRTITLSLRYLAFLVVVTITAIICLITVLALQVKSKTVHVPVSTSMDASRDWGYLSVYADNPDNLFGIDYVGLPSGCHIEQVHVLQHSAQRQPMQVFEEGSNNGRFAQKLIEWRSQDSKTNFIGDLTFLNDYQYDLQNNGALTRTGAATEFQRGAAVWNTYGEQLYAQAATQLGPSTRPFVRSAGSNPVTASVPYWLAGFTGTSGNAIDAIDISAPTSSFDYLVIPEAEGRNSTLSSYDIGANANMAPINELGDLILEAYIPIYLHDALTRLQAQTPPDFVLTTDDLYAMQSICAFETNILASSPFCSLFMPAEWTAFSHTSDQMF